jgi:hypothetical protein
MSQISSQKQDAEKQKYRQQVRVFHFAILIQNIDASPATARAMFSPLSLLMPYHAVDGLSATH